MELFEQVTKAANNLDTLKAILFDVYNLSYTGWKEGNNKCTRKDHDGIKLCCKGGMWIAKDFSGAVLGDSSVYGTYKLTKKAYNLSNNNDVLAKLMYLNNKTESDFEGLKEKYQREEKPSQATYIQPQIVQKTMQCYEANNFVIFLHSYFKDTDLVNELIKRFRIGTAKGNRTVFWQVDSVGQVRTGQTIYYIPATGKRDKQTRVGWVHTDMKLSPFVLKQCFFGEHQLQTASTNKPIAIVESPKTAVIMTAIDNRYVWLASCGWGGIGNDCKWQALEGRTVHLFPDVGKYTEWQSEAQKITIANVKVSDMLEHYCINELSEEQRAAHKGYDIADYAIQFDWYVRPKAKTNQQNMSIDDRMLQTMIASNPNITLLIERFECINPKTMKAFNI